MTANNFSEDCFIEYVKNTHRSEIQRKRGGKGGKLSNSGGRPKGSFNIIPITLKKEWESLGVSRATFYRRLKNEKK